MIDSLYGCAIIRVGNIIFERRQKYEIRILCTTTK